MSTERLGLIYVIGRSCTMPTARHRKERRDRQASEVEQSQAALRKSIDETERLVEESDEMLRRHRREQQDGDESRARPGN